MNNSIQDLERLYPDEREKVEPIAGNDTYQLHLERYHYAGKHLAPGQIGDIACGAGYGSYLLATEYGSSIEKLTAVDINEEAIAHAKKNYAHPRINYQLSDAMGFQTVVLFNTIISLETIEHLEKPLEFISHMTSQLKPGGRFIASAPVTPSMDANPFHKQDFTLRSFKKMFLDNGFVEIDSYLQIQRYQPLGLLARKSGREKQLRKNILGYYLKHPSKFFLRLGSLVKDGFANKYLVIVFEKK